MAEKRSTVTFKGQPMTLVGREVKVGSPARPFTLTANDLSDLSDKTYQGKVLVLSVVPSLDTPLCAVQTRTFNERATALSPDVAILTVSMDLPFAQKRFCGAEGINRVVTASDYKHRVFGEAYGVLIAELGLLTRAVFVIDRKGKVTHAEYVPEISREPSYEAALKAVTAAL
jgi:thiol peroxidase